MEGRELRVYFACRCLFTYMWVFVLEQVLRWWKVQASFFSNTFATEFLSDVLRCDSGHFLLSIGLIQRPFKKGHLTVQLSLGIGKHKHNHYFYVVIIIGKHSSDKERISSTTTIISTQAQQTETH